MYILDMLWAAGPLLWVLAALSLYVVYLILLRLQVLSKLAADPTLILTRVHAALMQQDLAGAQREARRLSTPAANVLRAGLERAPAGPESATAAMNEAMLIEDQRLYAGISTLGTVAQIAPLLGLLGTVFGMVRSFAVFATVAAPSPNQLATGISEALINTAAGLIVAITAYFGRNLLRDRADRVAVSAERVRETLPSWITEMQLRRQGALSGAPIAMYDPSPVRELNS
ncbi:biopolymer transport protein ExbB [Deinobacterium chartae]|uniref:Biopolymer transport protein ExbB n=1 Tax=Deinobacterium chartae TaxID=521158 RepID=A0A841HZA4_9DEIO|nr:MotA/TolQ/ExbB proton channel family protein [Deinobacterium chartae]MBB6098727.1 biopolymer transport protein ExbB [Deinobacterium chartae]